MDGHRDNEKTDDTLGECEEHEEYEADAENDEEDDEEPIDKSTSD